MPKLSATVAHEYDANLVYHTQSSNLPHLGSWIDELINLTEGALPYREHPTTVQLVESLHRYDTVFKELIKQTHLYSDVMSRLFAKIWMGVLKLMDYMVKAYHRYVKHTTHLQEQAQVLLKDKRGQMAAAIVREDEHELERTVMKAQIRNLESEVEALKVSGKGLERENAQLRTIIDVYVRAQEMNDAVWEVMDNDEALAGTTPIYDEDEDESMTRKRQNCNSVEASKNQLRTLCRLDVEMNEVLAGVLKEEDRQRSITNELGLLIQKNPVFTHSNRGGIKQMGGMGSGGVHGTAEMAVQVDEKDNYGCVLDSIPTPRPAASDDVVPHKKKGRTGPPMGGRKARADDEENNDTSLSLTQKEEPPPAPIVRPPNGNQIPYLLRKCMSSYPRVLRVPPTEWVCQIILSIYFDRIRSDQTYGPTGDKVYPFHHRVRPLGEFLYDHFKKTLGISGVADVQVAQLIKATEIHMQGSKRITLFANMIGIFEKEKPPSLDPCDSAFVMSVLVHLLRLGELQADKPKSKKMKATTVTIKSDITRVAATQTVAHMFEKWLPDGGTDYVKKVEGMAQSAKGHRFVHIDDYIELMVDFWSTVRLTWEEHIRYVFHHHCGVFKVAYESQYSNDEGIVERDTLLIELDKASTFDCSRRTMRTVQKKENAPDKEVSHKSVAVNPNKEAVCEVMTKKHFQNAIWAMNPRISQEEVCWQECFD